MWSPGMKVRALADITFVYDHPNGGQFQVDACEGEVWEVVNVTWYSKQKEYKVELEYYKPGKRYPVNVYFWSVEWDKWDGVLELVVQTTLRDQRVEIIVREL